MQVVDTPLEGLKIVELDVFGDSRGFFVERYNEAKFADHGLPTKFLQDNHSRSAPGVLRGLHFQPTPAQGKLVGCVNGRIWDVAVDIRPGSPTLGQHFGLELSCENGKLLWIPGGFAHGFCVLGDKPADVYYKCTAMYNPKGEQGIAWNDSVFSVAWPFDDMVFEDDKPTTSTRDDEQQSFADYQKNPATW
jgi:dTDP-4-dehydrorhamnose 3,5-epimerase